MPRLPHMIATVGGAGFFPKAPGTIGSLIAVVFYLLVFPAEPSVLIHTVFFLILTAVFFAGVWASGLAEAAYGHDPSCVVIDEVVGMGLSLLWLPMSWTWALAAFVVFRIMDVTKWLGSDRMQRLPGGWGIMMDDVVAGLWTNVFMQIVILGLNRIVQN